MLAAETRQAKIDGKRIVSILVSQPRRGLYHAVDALSKRLQLAGKHWLGKRTFLDTTIEEAVAMLRSLAPYVDPPPEAPVVETKHKPLGKEKTMSKDELVKAPGLPTLEVANTAIRQDAEGRYCLNDLHKAAGGEAKHQPAFFMRRQETNELIEEIVRSADLQSLDKGLGGNSHPLKPVVSVLGKGKEQGTYVCKELVYAYAMWISPKFHLMVIRAFDALVTGRKPEVGALPQECEEACDVRAWVLLGIERDRIKRLLGNAMRSGDEERLTEGLYWVKQRLHETLREIARQHLADGGKPRAVACWILNYRPAWLDTETTLH